MDNDDPTCLKRVSHVTKHLSWRKRGGKGSCSPHPGILTELLAVDLLDGLADAVLGAQHERLEPLPHVGSLGLIPVPLLSLAEEGQGSLVERNLLLDADGGRHGGLLAASDDTQLLHRNGRLDGHGALGRQHIGAAAGQEGRGRSKAKGTGGGGSHGGLADGGWWLSSEARGRAGWAQRPGD